MSKRKIHIGNLKIRLPRTSAGQARAIAGGLGKEILHGIAKSTAGKSGARKIGEISAGKISVTGGADAPKLQQQIAGRVMDELRRSFE